MKKYLYTTQSKGNDYWYFQTSEKPIYLGPVDNPDKINQEKIIDCLDYLTKQKIEYETPENQLLSFLNLENRDIQLSKQIPYQTKSLIKSISSLSDIALQEKYIDDMANALTKIRRQKQKAIENNLSGRNKKLQREFTKKIFSITKKYNSDQQIILDSLASDKKTCIRVYDLYQKNKMTEVHEELDVLYNNLVKHGVNQKNV